MKLTVMGRVAEEWKLNNINYMGTKPEINRK